MAVRGSDSNICGGARREIKAAKTKTDEQIVCALAL